MLQVRLPMMSSPGQGVAGAAAGAVLRFYYSQWRKSSPIPRSWSAFDDHMVHRGHASSTPQGRERELYDLEAPPRSFQLSADRSKLRLPASRAEMREII